MYDKNLNNLEMKLNNDSDNDNDNYYIQKLNRLINEYQTKVLDAENIKIEHVKEKEKSCWEWICEMFSFKQEENIENSPFIGINNIGNNCYLNAGLQILSRCYPLLVELLKLNYENDKLMKLFVEAMITLLFKKEKFYNPTKFIECFCKRNKDFIEGQQNCSQDFIRTILRNINETFNRNIRYEDYSPSNQKEYNAYKTFILENNIFPETKAYSIFSGMLKIHINGMCSKCREEINNYSFSSFVDQQIYLDSFNTYCKFSDVLRKNIGENIKATMRCPKCNQKTNLKSISKFVKIPEIFIFTLERYLVRNKVPIEPDELLDLSLYVDESYDIEPEDCLYELFAINIRKGNDLSFGHEICQIKQKYEWYTIDDGDSYKRQKEFNQYNYGLFYRRIHKKK